MSWSIADVYLRGARRFDRKKPAVDNPSWWWPSGCQIERWWWYESVPTCAVQTSTWEPAYCHQSKLHCTNTNIISHVITLPLSLVTNEWNNCLASHRLINYLIPFHDEILDSTNNQTNWRFIILKLRWRLRVFNYADNASFYQRFQGTTVK